MRNVNSRCARKILRTWLSHQPRLNVIINRQKMPLNSLFQLMIGSMHKFVILYLARLRTVAECIRRFMLWNGIDDNPMYFRTVERMYRTLS